LEGHSEWVEEIHFSPRDLLMATASADGTVIVRDFENKSILKRLEGHSGLLAWTSQTLGSKF